MMDRHAAMGAALPPPPQQQQAPATAVQQQQQAPQHAQQQQHSLGMLVDEEDCLGLELFVAELELVLGPKDSRPDQTQLLELLQKLHASIGAADAAAVKRCQRRCEAALADLLRRGAGGAGGAAAPVRALACACMSRLFAAGDALPLYGRVSALLGELQERDRGAAGEPQRLAALELLAHLSAAHGRALGSSAVESAAAAGRAALKGATPALRLAGMRLAAAVVGGLGPSDRSGAAVQAEAWKLFDRGVKVRAPARADRGGKRALFVARARHPKLLFFPSILTLAYAHTHIPCGALPPPLTQDKACEEQRAAALSIAAAIARAGGGALWAGGGGGWEEACRACVAALDDPSRVRHGYLCFFFLRRTRPCTTERLFAEAHTLATNNHRHYHGTTTHRPSAAPRPSRSPSWRRARAAPSWA